MSDDNQLRLQHSQLWLDSLEPQTQVIFALPETDMFRVDSAEFELDEYVTKHVILDTDRLPQVPANE